MSSTLLSRGENSVSGVAISSYFSLARSPAAGHALYLHVLRAPRVLYCTAVVFRRGRGGEGEGYVRVCTFCCCLFLSS